MKLVMTVRPTDAATFVASTASAKIARTALRTDAERVTVVFKASVKTVSPARRAIAEYSEVSAASTAFAKTARVVRPRAARRVSAAWVF